MPYSGDLFNIDSRWEDVTQEHKDDMHSRFLKALETNKIGLFELFSENILAFTPVLGATTFIALYKLGNQVFLFRKCIISHYLVYVDTPDVKLACTWEEFQKYDVKKHFQTVSEELFQEVLDQHQREAQRKIERNSQLNERWYKFMLGLLRAQDEKAFNEAFESVFADTPSEAKELIKETIKPITIETYM